MPELTETKEAPEEAHGQLVSGVVLPEDPGIEELARDWTLSEAVHWRGFIVPGHG
jgi:hypothetical protein